MAARSRSRLLLALALPPVAVAYGTHRCLNVLEAKYPDKSAAQTSLAVRTPRDPSTQYCAYVDVYSARVPVRALQARVKRPDGGSRNPDQALTTAWAQTLFGNRLFRAEGSLIGLFTKKGFHPGDLGDGPDEFSPDAESGSPRSLANGALVVERPPSDEYGLLVSWKMPDEPRLFFERISRWGYPWRLMSGGRHEISVSEPFDGEGEEKGTGPFVDVRFVSAHDYELFSSEGGLKEQKIVPEWTARLHRGYARLLLDVAVRELEREGALHR